LNDVNFKREYAKLPVFAELWEKIEHSQVNGHDELRKLLEGGNIFIGDRIPNKAVCNLSYEEFRKLHFKNEVKYETVLGIILVNVFNGHELILHILDGLVQKIDKKLCSKCVDNISCSDDKSEATIKIKLDQMFEWSYKPELSHKIKWLVSELIDIQRERENDKHIRKIFDHPVIELLILNKWEDYKISYVNHLRRFAMIVFLFTFLVRLRILDESQKRCDVETANGTDLSDCSDWMVNQTKNETSECNTWFGKCDYMIVFEYKNVNIIVFGAVMIGLFFIQLFSLSCALVQRFIYRDDQLYRKRKSQEIINSFGNAFYLLLANLLCLNPRPNLTLRIALCLICVYLLVTEIIHFSILVLGPAVKCFKKKSVYESSTSDLNGWFMGVLVWFESISRAFKTIVRNRYFRDPENYLELICVSSVLLAIFSNTWPLVAQEKSEAGRYEAVFRYIVAMGVFAAWTELIIKLGNVSHCVVGDFIKMFYNIIKTNLLAYLKVFFLLMTAFSLSFWIILEGHIKKKKDDLNFSSGLWVNMVATVTMSFGEFNTNDFYDEIDEKHEMIRIFAMLFLAGLVIFSTIAMVNLLVAAIISDYQKMKEEGKIETLYFIAEYIVEEEEYDYKINISKIMTILCLNIGMDDEDKGVLEYCPRLICNNCKMEPLPIPRPGVARCNAALEAAEREPLLSKLLELRGSETGMCKYHDETSGDVFLFNGKKAKVKKELKDKELKKVKKELKEKELEIELLKKELLEKEVSVM